MTQFSPHWCKFVPCFYCSVVGAESEQKQREWGGRPYGAAAVRWGRRNWNAVSFHFVSQIYKLLSSLLFLFFIMYFFFDPLLVPISGQTQAKLTRHRRPSRCRCCWHACTPFSNQSFWFWFWSIWYRFSSHKFFLYTFNRLKLLGKKHY